MRIAMLFNRLLLSSISVLALILIATSGYAQLGAMGPGIVADQATPPFSVNPSEVYSGVAHVANGAGLRNSPSATIRLRGMPSDAYVVAAWLYWDFTSLTSPTNLQSKVIFGKVTTFVNPSVLLYGTQIGTGLDPCWFGGSNFAFRADVTKVVRGNGDYMVTLLHGAASSTNGSDPWSASSPTTGRSQKEPPSCYLYQLDRAYRHRVGLRFGSGRPGVQRYTLV